MQPRRYLRKEVPIKGILPVGAVAIEALQLVGDPVDTMAVCEWVRDCGYPWLLGNALQPETLIPEGGGKPGDRGIYLDPATGELVIHSEHGDTRASYGTWIIRVARGNIYTCSNRVFTSLYEPI